MEVVRWIRIFGDVVFDEGIFKLETEKDKF